MSPFSPDFPRFSTFLQAGLAPRSRDISVLSPDNHIRIFYISSSLVVQGYFWELTSSIISRDVDIVANNIYSGKIKSVFVISLPDFKPAKFIWRGFASIVASIMMVLPYALLVFSTAFTGVFTLPMLEIGNFHSIYAICYNLLYVFFFAFLPAMLWNYAKENSVFAVWNIRKAVYLLGTYPGKYILNTFVFVIFYLFFYYRTDFFRSQIH